jgi:hypothetical protein
LINKVIILNITLLMDIISDQQITFYIIMTFSVIIGMLLMTMLFSAQDNKEMNVESKQESNNVAEDEEEDSEYEYDSDDNTNAEDSEKSEMSEEITSVLYKSFSLLTKKQLLKITGSKYKYENKDI